MLAHVGLPSAHVCRERNQADHRDFQLSCNAIYSMHSIYSPRTIYLAQTISGWLDGHWKQLGYQMAWICFATGWTAVGTFVIMLVIDHIPGLHFRSNDDDETCGLDEAECGEVRETVHAKLCLLPKSTCCVG